jgi:hypothetical protein
VAIVAPSCGVTPACVCISGRMGVNTNRPTPTAAASVAAALIAISHSVLVLPVISQLSRPPFQSRSVRAVMATLCTESSVGKC